MAYNLRNRSFLSLRDFTPREISFLLKLSADLKTAKYAGTEVPTLQGKNIALIFEKDSTRTRVGFEVAAYDQGANVTFLGPTGNHIGHKETVKDTARVLGRVYDAIEYRGFGHEIVEQLAEFSNVPVYNGLTKEFHPTQILADLLTMQEHVEKPLHQVSYAFVGDAANNMGDSLLIGGAKLGMDVRLCAPKACWPTASVQDEAHTIANDTGAQILITEDVDAAVKGVDFVYTDVWVSMGEAKEKWAERIEMLTPYQVNAALMAKTGNPRTRFMHCLPAFHNTDTTVGAEIKEQYGIDAMEVTEEVFESPASVVFDQAENRMHTIKAVLVATLGHDMLVIAALGGNALLHRGQPLTADAQRANVKLAARSLAEIVRAGHQLVVTHGNGPQVGLLALQAASYKPDEAYPLDVLGAETEGMIGYMIEQELENALNHDKPVATLLTQVVVDADDPAFGKPTKFVGPVYTKEEAEKRAKAADWAIAPDGDAWRRVVASPKPVEIPDLKVIKLLLGQGVIVVCTGGGGNPVLRSPDGSLTGVEAVIDKDAASCLLASQLGADALLLLTDVDGVYRGFGSDNATRIHTLTDIQAHALDAPAGSMGPKLQAAGDFAQTGGIGGIGRLEDAVGILEGHAGTRIMMASTSVDG